MTEGKLSDVLKEIILEKKWDSAIALNQILSVLDESEPRMPIGMIQDIIDQLDDLPNQEEIEIKLEKYNDNLSKDTFSCKIEEE